MYLCSNMGRYVIQNETTKGIKKLLPKYGSVSIEDEKLKGSVQVIGYRKYTHYEEIDIQFTGQILARISREKLQWFDSSILNDEHRRISKVKVNRFIKRLCLREVRLHLNYFGINLKDYSQIKKINWI